MRVRCFALAAMLVSALAAFGQAPPANDPKDILRKADEAARKLKGIRYEATGEIEGGARMAGSVTLEGIPGAEFPKLLLDATLTPPGAEAKPARFQIAADAKSVVVLDHGDRTYAFEPLPRGVGLANVGFLLLMREFVSPDPFGDELKAKQSSYAGTSKVGEIDCHMIDVAYADGSSARWHFAKDTMLPWRVDRSVPDGDHVGRFSLAISKMELNPNCTDAMFQLSKPEGFRVLGSTAAAKPATPTKPAPPKSGKLLEIGAEAPDFTLKDHDGKSVNLKALRGKVVVLDFWATWCNPCIRSMPSVQKLYDDYKDKGVMLYGVNAFERPNRDSVKFMRDKKLTYPILLDGTPVANEFLVVGIPSFYVIDKAGKVVFADSGFKAELEEKVRQAIDAANK